MFFNVYTKFINHIYLLYSFSWRNNDNTSYYYNDRRGHNHDSTCHTSTWYKTSLHNFKSCYCFKLCSRNANVDQISPLDYLLSCYVIIISVFFGKDKWLLFSNDLPQH